MILSVSRRTDIPAFYSDWFINRLKSGFVLVRNPMNYHQVSKISLSPSVIDCIVFWTKNPQPLFNYLDYLDKEYKFYFQYTINAYDEDVEPNIPCLENRIDNFIYLSKRYGEKSVIWRYDPIFISEKYNLEWHLNKFKYISSRLKGYTKACVFSYIDIYSKNQANLKNIGIKNFNQEEMICIAKSLSLIAKEYQIELKSCCENIDLSKYNVKKSCCIDPILISEIVNNKIIANKDKNQRESCGCVESVDIGQYNTCKHGCIYCYANYQKKVVDNNVLKHDDNSPLLIGSLEEEDKIHVREIKSLKDNQVSLFDL